MRARTLSESQVVWLRAAWTNPEIGTREVLGYLKIGGGRLMRLRDELQLGPKKGFYWTRELVDELRALSAQGLLPSEISERMGLTNNTVYQKLKRLGSIGGVLLKPATRPITPEYEVMLRRVAAWDRAAASGLAALERQRAASNVVYIRIEEDAA